MAADAIRTAFHPTTPVFSRLIDCFLTDRQLLVKGACVSTALVSPPPGPAFLGLTALQAQFHADRLVR